MLGKGIITSFVGASPFIALALIPLLESQSFDDAIFTYLLVLLGFWPVTFPLAILFLALLVQGIRMICAGARGRRSAADWAFSLSLSLVGLASIATVFFLL